MTTEIDKANAEFWNELCGSSLARHLGITDHSEESLRRFDEAYLDFYPYLLHHVKLDNLSGKRVLEIGLGYGTLGQKLIEAEANYVGVDIAAMPVKMMQHRLRMLELPGTAVQGSVLDCPFKNKYFDFIVSIGCFHHTGNLKRCIDETFGILKPGGVTILMVYNQFSYRQWYHWPRETFLVLLRDIGLMKKSTIHISKEKRKAYDSSQSGEAAPETVFSTIRQLRTMLKQYSRVKFHKENCSDLLLFNKYFISRSKLMPNLGKIMGLDLYIEAIK
jgi:2-polyprenyl-3-methyl-5-hydroxy-6-metoxy-1,4-benzoquinol methylase